MSTVVPTVPPYTVEGSEFQISGSQIVLILCGLIASGKSTFAEALQREYPEFRRCNQDDLGDRRLVEQLVRKTLNEGHSVCIDRTNFNEVQRSYWIEIAREFPQTAVWIIVFDTPYEICADRLKNRTPHPTIKSPEQGLSVLSRFAADFQRPARWEGYERILYLKPSDHPSPVYDRSDITAIILRIQSSPPITLADTTHRGVSGPGSGSNCVHSPSFRGNLNRGHTRGVWRGYTNYTRPYPNREGVPSRGRGSFSNAGPTVNRRDYLNQSASNTGINEGAVRGTGQTDEVPGYPRNKDNWRERRAQGSGTGEDPFVID